MSAVLSEANFRTTRFVALTFGELSSWHAIGETHLIRSRVLDICAEESSAAAGHRFSIRRLMRSLPPLSLDDEEGVLIVRLTPGQLVDDAEDTQLVRIPIERIDGVVPVTTRARSILLGRLQAFGMIPEEALFEREFTESSRARRIQLSAKAGDELVEALLPDVVDLPGTEFRNAASLALITQDFSDMALPIDESCVDSRNWVGPAFGWTRHKPYDHGAVNHLLDAGSVLKDILGDGELADFREAAKCMVKEYGASRDIKQILDSEVFVSSALQLQSRSSGVFPAGLSALVLYLRWQERLHKNDSSIDVNGVVGDLQQLRTMGALQGDIIAALWLLGFYAGMERVKPLLYAMTPERYAWFHGDRVVVRRTEVPVPADTDMVDAPSAEGGCEEISTVTPAKSEAWGEDVPSAASPASEEATEAPQSESLFGDALQDYGPLPWSQHRKDADAKRVALEQAKEQMPELGGDSLYREVAIQWFGYRKLTQKFLDEIEALDRMGCQ